MSQTRNPTRADGAPKQAWWRVGMMWLVLGGPATVVVASLVTAVVAYRGADEVLTETNEPAADATAANRALAPAMTARNHAATPNR
jgi:hypothetical protein